MSFLYIQVSKKRKTRHHRCTGKKKRGEDQYIYIYSCGRTPNVLYHNLKYNYIAAQPLPPIIFPELVKKIIYSLILDMNNQKIIKKGSKNWQNTYNSLFFNKILLFFICINFVKVTNRVWGGGVKVGKDDHHNNCNCKASRQCGFSHELLWSTNLSFSKNAGTR